MKKKPNLRRGNLERKNEVIRMGFSKECKTELIQALRKIFDDKDFVLGVLCDLGSDKDIQTVLDSSIKTKTPKRRILSRCR